MMRSRTSWLAILLLLGALSPTCASVFRPTELINFPGSPFEILAAQSSTPAPATGLFALEFRARNTGPEELTQIGIEAVVLSPQGEPKGFYQFPIKTSLKPGVSTYLGYGVSRVEAGKINVSAGDRVVLMPYSATGRRLHWEAADADLREARASLKAGAADASLFNIQGESKEPENQPGPGDPGGGGTCLACQNAYSACESVCHCGVSSVGCNCSGGGSQSCSCFQCPPPPPPPH